MCVSPISIRYQDEEKVWHSQQVACGKCVECLRDYQNGWKIRLSEEFAESCKGVFFTLTYEPLSAPLAFDQETGELIETDEFAEQSLSTDKRPLSLRVKDVQDWLKRCRERAARDLGERLDFSYFICGEYGPKTLRPHYHGIFFNIDYETFKVYFQNEWQQTFGFVDSSKIETSEGKSPQRVANYVSKYCSKGSFENPRVQRGYVEKPRKLISKGIGKRFADRIAAEKLCGYREVSAEIDTIHRLPRLCYSDDLPVFGSSPYQVTYTLDPLGRVPLDVYHGLCRDSISGIHQTSDVAFYYPPKKRVKPSPESHWATVLPQLKRAYLRPSSSLLSRIVSLMKIDYYDLVKNETFSYKMPRYIRGRIYGERSALSQEIKAFLQNRNDEVYRQQFRELQTRYPTWTAPQIDHYIDMQERSRRKSSEASARQALTSFYNKSNL